MANGIEHKSVDSVMEAFRSYDLPNFSIWAGKQLRVKYEGGNWDEGLQELLNYLNVILAANTQCVYSLRVYPEDVTHIDNKTPYDGSTTFMLSPAVPTTTQNGVTIIDRNGNQVGSSRTDPAVLRELEQLRTKTDQLQSDLNRKEIELLKQDFDHQIAGLKREYEEQPELSWGDKALAFFEKLLEKPEVIEKTGKAIAGIFNKGNNYIIEHPQVVQTSPISGTNTETEQEMETTIFENHFLTPEERKLKKHEQSELMIQRLTPLDDDKHQDIQNECLTSLETRIGNVTLSRMLLAVAGLDNHELNKLISHLD